MSPSPPTVYRCPSCSAPASTDEQTTCSCCGYGRSEDSATWVVEPGDLLPGPTPTPIPGGPRFADRYEVLEEIGRGGMGIVHRARDRELDEIIALKVLAPAAGASPDLVLRFKHEVKVARQLTHPSIARLHDLLEIRGQLCLSMEYIEGRSLREVMANGPMPSDRVVGYLRHLASALDVAHQRGVVHRDLKPGNVLIDLNDLPRILDFGIAKSEWLKEVSEDGFVGTPPYMAPEQWRPGTPLDGRADLYSLGVMLYEMLSGRRPFDHRNRLILMEMHLSKAAPPLSLVAPGVPTALVGLVHRLLEKDPARRPARAAEVLEALEGPAAAAGRRAARSGAMARPAPGSQPAGKGRVLVADDDPGVRRILSRQMRARDLVVLEAANGAEALEKAFAERPDLILLDLRMPVLDGLEALRLVKNDPRTRDATVIVMSGEGSADTIAFSKENGAASFLEKPISADVLDLLVERYFD